MACFTEEREVWVEDSGCQEGDELLEGTASIHSIFNLVILVDEDDLPLLPWIDIVANNPVDSVLK